MSLDKKVIKDFVAAVNKKEETKTPTILTGTVHREGGTVSVMYLLCFGSQDGRQA